MNNLYWNVYKSLERELLSLSEAIHIDDEQLNVYSMKIADLLMRVAVEVEAISKELYFRESGTKPNNKDLYFDTDCLKLLEDKWTLSKKVVMVSSVSLYFEKDENRYLTPLHKAHKRGSSSSDWLKAYQAVKHDRTNNLKKGNLKHFIHGLAALYILNLYYMNQTFDLGKDSNTTTFDASVGSSIFSVKVHKLIGVSALGIYEKQADFDECIFLIHATDKTLQAMLGILKLIGDESVARTAKQMADEINEKKIPKEEFENMKDEFKKKKQENDIHIIREKAREINKASNSLRFEAVLNKNQS